MKSAHKKTRVIPRETQWRKAARSRVERTSNEAERMFAAGGRSEAEFARTTARWSSGQDGGLSRRNQEFDSPTGHQTAANIIQFAAVFLFGL